MMMVQDFLHSMEYGPAPESRALADAWLKQHGHCFGLYIDGRFDQAGPDLLASYAPSDGEKLADITLAGEADISRAVTAARKAQGGWRTLGGHGRARYLYAIARAIQKKSRLFAVLESLDNGKPIRETRDVDIPLVIRHFYHHAGWAQILDQEFPDYEPIGVAGQIIPWNFPLLMLAWKVAPALAAGNTVVIKPAEETSLTALLFAEICDMIGLPKGVMNIVTGAEKTGQLLVKSDIDKIAFTGSTDVGKSIRHTLAGSGKKLTLELGGKSPFIVFDDADMDSAVEGLVDAIWFNQGQVCCAGSRLIVQESIADRFYEKLKRRMATLRIGPSLDKCIDIGALINPSHKKRIMDRVAKGRAEGAIIYEAPCALPALGSYLPPMLITDVGTDNSLLREEIFGPVLTAMTFRTQGEAVMLANNTVYGLAASIWSESVSRTLEVASDLKAGVVWINGANMFDAAVGFGGFRQSGVGREGGREGMLAYLKPRFEESLPQITQIPVPSLKPDVIPDCIIDSESTPESTGVAARAVPPSLPPASLPPVDRTAKLYIGGRQTRSDSGDSIRILDWQGYQAGFVAKGSIKDIRDCVEAARKALSWGETTAHYRAQILYYLAENLSIRAREMVSRLETLTGMSAELALKEVDQSISRLYSAAAYADKVDGRISQPPLRGVALAINEPIGVIGMALPDQAPLLAMITLVSHALAAGNCCIVLPSERFPLLATDFYQILETSDVPAGVVNIVTGSQRPLAMTLAHHYGVEALWHFGTAAEAALLEQASTDSMKRCWLSYGKAYDWYDSHQLTGRFLLEKAYETKSIWIPYGDQNAAAKSY